MLLLIGLGNPGKEYKNTRHNMGAMCVDSLREKFAGTDWKLEKKFRAEMSESSVEGKKCLFAKPVTFMNLSGESVQTLVQFYKITPENLWIFYDDIDLPLGKIRIRPDGSAGTHNGMKSVIEHLGFQNFPRIRIGIESRGAGAPKEQDISSFVLHPFSKEEKKLAKQGIACAADAFLLALQSGMNKAQEKYN